MSDGGSVDGRSILKVAGRDVPRLAGMPGSSGLLVPAAILALLFCGCACDDYQCMDTVQATVQLDIPSTARATLEVTACRNADCLAEVVHVPPQYAPGTWETPVDMEVRVDTDSEWLGLRLMFLAWEGTFEDGDVWHIAVTDQETGDVLAEMTQQVDEYELDDPSCGQDCAWAKFTIGAQ
jgi:hypothetical protein